MLSVHPSTSAGVLWAIKNACMALTESM